MTNPIRAGWLGAILTTGLIGCFKPIVVPESKTVPGTNSGSVASQKIKPDDAGSLKVKSDGACLQLGELQKTGMTEDSLLRSVGELLEEGRTASARRLILRFPDVAEAVILGCDPARTNDPAVVLVAQVLDGVSDSGWSQWLAQRNGPLQSYAEQRAEAVIALQKGDAQKVIDRSLPNKAPHGPAAIEAYRLHGQALLLLERPEEAVPFFTRGAEAATHYPARSAACLLMCGEAYRRAGHAVEARTHWSQAVATAARLVSPTGLGFDPVFWERAAYLKPVDVAWPEPAIHALSAFAQKRVIQSPAHGSTVPEMWVWTAIGQGRFDRADYHSALTAFKRAETMTADRDARDGFAVAQAHTLLLMNQPQAAQAMLIAIAGRADSRSAPAATALLGSMKLAEGAAEASRNLLMQALAKADDWPGRAEAEANLGLAHLSIGYESLGLQSLASARQRFQADDDVEQLSMTWLNEARYWENVGKPAPAAAAREAAKRVEAVHPESAVASQ